MFQAILAVMNTTVSVLRKSARDSDMNREYETIGVYDARIEDAANNLHMVSGIDFDVKNIVYVVETALTGSLSDVSRIKPGDEVVFPDGTHHEILNVSSGVLINDDHRYTVIMV